MAKPLRFWRRLLAVAALLAIPAPGWAQPEQPRPVATAVHFSFFSDLAVNLNDALIAAGRARRAKSQELFSTGAEEECFNRLTAAEREGWARAVDYFAEVVSPFDVNAREQILFRIEVMAGSDWATGNDRTFMAITRSMRAAARPPTSAVAGRSRMPATVAGSSTPRLC